MRLRLTKPAQLDFENAVHWVKSQLPWLAEEFLDDLEKVFKTLVINPRQFPKVEVEVSNTTREWRRAILRRFSYIVIYFIADNAVVIGAIRHTSTDWTSQLTDKDE
jgi:plasmid stabilization system protein ParE